jgi:hypothetical protein
MNMLNGWREKAANFIPQGIKERVKESAEKAVSIIPQGIKDRAEKLREKGQQILTQGREFMDDVTAPSVATTEVLTEENFKEQLRKMKDNFIEILKNKYKVENPDIDCLLKKEYVKVYTNKTCLQDPLNLTKCVSIDDTRWFNVFAKPKQYGWFDTFDDLLADDNVTLENFVRQHNLGRDGGIKFSMKIDMNNVRNKKIQMLCQPPAVTSPAVTSGGGGRRMRRSSRKHYKKVRTAKHARSSKSRNTRRQRK